MISLVWTYAGLQPQEMEQRITSNVRTRRHHAGQRRRAHRIAIAERHRGHQSLLPAERQYPDRAGANHRHLADHFCDPLPPGTTPPLVIIYSASTVPVIQIGLTSDTLSEQQLFDFGNNFIRTQLATVQGAAIPFPYGGKQRLVSVDIDSQPCRPRAFRPSTSSTRSTRRT